MWFDCSKQLEPVHCGLAVGTSRGAQGRCSNALASWLVTCRSGSLAAIGELAKRLPTSSRPPTAARLWTHSCFSEGAWMLTFFPLCPPSHFTVSQSTSPVRTRCTSGRASLPASTLEAAAIRFFIFGLVFAVLRLGRVASYV
jgi:hypothetical protein